MDKLPLLIHHLIRIVMEKIKQRCCTENKTITLPIILFLTFIFLRSLFALIFHSGVISPFENFKAHVESVDCIIMENRKDF